MNHPFRSLFVEVPVKVGCESCRDHMSFVQRKICALEEAIKEHDRWWGLSFPEILRRLGETHQRLTFELYKMTTK